MIPFPLNWYCGFNNDLWQYDYVEVTRDIISGSKIDCPDQHSADSASHSGEKTTNITDVSTVVYSE